MSGKPIPPRLHLNAKRVYSVCPCVLYNVPLELSGGAMKPLCNTILVAVLALSLAVPAGFAAPQQSPPSTKDQQPAATDQSTTASQPQTQDQQSTSSSSDDEDKA